MGEAWVYSVNTVISPQQIYTGLNVEKAKRVAPEGWKIVAFRPPKANEAFVPVCGESVMTTGTTSGYKEDSPRFILEKLPEEPRWRFLCWTYQPPIPEKVVYQAAKVYLGDKKIPEGWRVIGFRPPGKGEWFMPVFGSLAQRCEADFVGDAPRLIVTLE